MKSYGRASVIDSFCFLLYSGTQRSVRLSLDGVLKIKELCTGQRRMPCLYPSLAALVTLVDHRPHNTVIRFNLWKATQKIIHDQSDPAEWIVHPLINSDCLSSLSTMETEVELSCMFVHFTLKAWHGENQQQPKIMRLDQEQTSGPKTKIKTEVDQRKETRTLSTQLSTIRAGADNETQVNGMRRERGGQEDMNWPRTRIFFNFHTLFTCMHFVFYYVQI